METKQALEQELAGEQPGTLGKAVPFSTLLAEDTLHSFHGVFVPGKCSSFLLAHFIQGGHAIIEDLTNNEGNRTRFPFLIYSQTLAKYSCTSMRIKSQLERCAMDPLL